MATYSLSVAATRGFVSAELLVDGALESNVYLGLVVVLASMLNGIAVMRAYFLIFTGARHASTVYLQVGLRERIAVLTLSALLIGGGLFPQPGLSSREHAAEKILKERRARLGEPEPKAAPTHHD